METCLKSYGPDIQVKFLPYHTVSRSLLRVSLAIYDYIWQLLVIHKL